ncbi:MAG: serine/threonine protein kinase, partial [Myxococcales bacterium]
MVEGRTGRRQPRGSVLTMNSEPAPSPSRLSLPPPNETGAARVGRYELLLELASGGMATVFVGRQRGAGGFERLVAVKRMHPHIGAVPELAESFLDEARIASQIHHPNVVSVLDVHEDDGERLLVMDYIDGTTLSTLVKGARKFDRRLPVGVAVHIVIEALRGLHAAHELRSITGDPLDVVHRDATPQNILLGADGGVRLTDFGIAKAAQRTVQTTTGNVKGKFRYMAPEQAMGKELDRRVDLFAMGAVLWELLTGKRFLAGSSDAEIIHNLVMGKFLPPHEVEPSVPVALSNLVMKALAELPEERWSTADLFADVLENWAREANQEVTPAELAELVNELCGNEISGRRKALREVIAGQRPPVNLTHAPKPIHNVTSEPGLGSNSALSVAGGLVSQETPALEVRPPLRRNPPVALIGVGAVALLAAGVIAVATKTSQEKSASAATAPSASMMATATVEPPPVEARVSVALSTEALFSWLVLVATAMTPAASRATAPTP